ncbi:MAG TPA: NfeD family protein [Lachnospiraceae bacterium]|nr:NfeD family protein [Lachnospiraceae bacterium]
MVNILLFWSVALIVFTAIEFASQQLVTIWFAVGSLGALTAAAAGASLKVQIIVFTITAFLLLIFTRPILKKALSFKFTDTNTRKNIGKLAVITQTVNPLLNTGRARLEDTDWIAVSENALEINVGTTVRVTDIDGAKLIVVPVSEKEQTKE